MDTGLRTYLAVRQGRKLSVKWASNILIYWRGMFVSMLNGRPSCDDCVADEPKTKVGKQPKY
jgi:hypothetical protein